MNKKLVALVSSITAFALPLVASADLGLPSLPGQIVGPAGLWIAINRILAFIWPVFIGVSVIMFLVAGFFFVTAQGDPAKIKEARQAVIWGVVGVIVAVLSISLPWIIQGALGI